MNFWEPAVNRKHFSLILMRWFCDILGGVIHHSGKQKVVISWNSRELLRLLVLVEAVCLTSIVFVFRFFLLEGNEYHEHQNNDSHNVLHDNNKLLELV